MPFFFDKTEIVLPHENVLLRKTHAGRGVRIIRRAGDFPYQGFLRSSGP